MGQRSTRFNEAEAINASESSLQTYDGNTAFVLLQWRAGEAIKPRKVANFVKGKYEVTDCRFNEAEAIR